MRTFIHPEIIVIHIYIMTGIYLFFLLSQVSPSLLSYILLYNKREMIQHIILIWSDLLESDHYR